MTKLLTSK